MRDYICLGCGESSTKDELLDDGNTCPSCGSDELVPPHGFVAGEFDDVCKLCGESEASHEDD